MKPQAERNKSGQELFSRLAKTYQALGSAKKRKVSKGELQKIEKQMREAIQFARKNDRCGNKFCGPAENIKNCSQDCGTSPAVCGDGICEIPEITTCIKDCLATIDIDDYSTWCHQQEGTSWHHLYCPHCGDGVVNPPAEECDNGENNNDLLADACRTNCKKPSCGDGVVDRGRGEQCEGSTFPCIASACVRRPPPPPTCSCKDSNDPVTCPTRPRPPNDSHFWTCSDATTPWTRLFGEGRGHGLAVDANGTITAVSWEPQPLPDPSYLVRQLDICGNVVWDQTMPGAIPWADQGDHIDIDLCGNSYVVGKGIFDESVFVKKLNFSDGTVLWSDFFGAPSGEIIQESGIAVDGDSNVYVTGFMDVEPGSEESFDIFLRKYDTTGALLWSVTYDEGDNDRSRAVEVHGDGIYVSGQIHYEGGGWKAFLGKFSPTTGALLWATNSDLSDIHGTMGFSSAQSPDGNVYQMLRATSGDVVKYSSVDGSILDTFTVAFAPAPEPFRPTYDIAIDSTGNLVISGLAIFGDFPSQTYSLWTNKYDPVARTFVWNDEIPTDTDPGYNPLVWLVGVALDPSGYVYSIGNIENPGAGIFEDTVVIRKLTPAGLTDGWPAP